jgi:hypothetical protein
MTATPRTLAVQAIPAPVVAELLRRDDAGRSPRIMIDESGGSPLRCCLRDARPGEKIALVSYAPLRRWAAESGADPGPYEELGPVFVHPEQCDGPETDGYPDGWRYRQQVLRAYNANGEILGGTVAEPQSDVLAAADELFTDQAVELIHTRNIVYGCYMLTLRRAG